MTLDAAIEIGAAALVKGGRICEPETGGVLHDYDWTPREAAEAVLSAALDEGYLLVRDDRATVERMAAAINACHGLPYPDCSPRQGELVRKLARAALAAAQGNGPFPDGPWCCLCGTRKPELRGGCPVRVFEPGGRGREMPHLIATGAPDWAMACWKRAAKTRELLAERGDRS